MIKNKLSIMKQAGMSNDNDDFQSADRSKQIVIPKDQARLGFAGTSLDCTGNNASQVTQSKSMSDKSRVLSKEQKAEIAAKGSSKITNFMAPSSKSSQSSSSSSEGNSNTNQIARNANNTEGSDDVIPNILQDWDGCSTTIPSEKSKQLKKDAESCWDDDIIEDSMFAGDDLLLTQAGAISERKLDLNEHTATSSATTSKVLRSQLPNSCKNEVDADNSDCYEIPDDDDFPDFDLIEGCNNDDD